MSEELDLEAIEARAKAATEGPWKEEPPVGTDDGAFEYATGPWHDQRHGDTCQAALDAKFIAHARTDIPALCAALREARAEVEKLKSEIQWQRDADGMLEAELKDVHRRYDRFAKGKDWQEKLALEAVARAAEAVEKSGLWDKDSNEYAYGVDAIRFLELADALAALRSHREEGK